MTTQNNKDAETFSEESQDHFDRIEIILREAHFQFEQFQSSINSLNEKIIGLFQIFLVTLTLEISFCAILKEEFEYENALANFLCIFMILISIVTLVHFFYLIKPKKYFTIDVFEPKRFEELSVAEKIDLSSDFFYHTRESYKSNQEPYIKLQNGVEDSLVLTFANLVLFFGLICSLILF